MGMFNAVMALSGAADIDLIEGERMSRHTTYRVGGPAALYVTCHSYHGLRRCIETLRRESVPWVLIGRGSNLLVSDKGYNGAVVVLGREFQRTVIAEDGCHVTVGAATVLSRLLNDMASKGLSGLEFAVGIPGTFGGAVSMNAGTRSESIDAVVESVVTYCPGEGMHYYDHDDVTWGYRMCGLPAYEIILEATLKLEPGKKEDIRARMERYLSRRKHTQPVGKASCGSVFKNPPERSVGAMVDDCGLKGFSIGGAEVSPVHANFIVNNGKASAQDVLSVIQHVHAKVKETYGVELQPEVKFLGF